MGESLKARLERRRDAFLELILRLDDERWRVRELVAEQVNVRPLLAVPRTTLQTFCKIHRRDGA
jgi:hypothetical protein